MSERYSTVFSLSSHFYLEGSPVLIEAGAIRKDEQTNNLLVQLKLRNISSKIIIACKVKINAYSVSGDQLEGVDSFSYLDLRVVSGVCFGTKTPIYLPNYETRRFTVCITQVVFADNSLWNADAVEWKQISDPDKIGDKLLDDSNVHDGELVKQYKLDVGESSDYYPEIKDGLFYCTCGSINMDSAEHCYSCGREYSDLARVLEDGYLTSRKEARMAREAEERRTKMQREAEERAAKLQKRQERNRRILKIAIPSIIALAIIAVAGYYVVSSIIIPKQKHDEAMQLIASGRYARAYRILAELGDDEAIVQSKNDRALQLLESGNYEEAYALYEELGNSEAIIQSQNDRALQLLESGNYEEAYALYEELGNSEAIIQNKNDRAMSLIESGNYDEAYALLVEIGNNEAITDSINTRADALIASGDYETAYSLLQETGNLDLLRGLGAEEYCQMLRSLDLSEGDIIVFGDYNGECEWQVLDVTDNEVLIISLHCVDRRSFDNDSNVWANSSLRSWLNYEYYNEAFNSTEQSMIQTVNNDNVFLLSIEEAESCFSDDQCRIADYNGVDYFWWLRSPGGTSNFSAVVHPDGCIIEYGFRVISTYGVRPAIWISLGSDG